MGGFAASILEIVSQEYVKLRYSIKSNPDCKPADALFLLAH